VEELFSLWLRRFPFLWPGPSEIPREAVEQSSIGSVRGVQKQKAKQTAPVGVDVGVIGNVNVFEIWTPCGITTDCPVLPSGFQWKSVHRNVLRIVQRETKTFQTVIRLLEVVFATVPVPHSRVPL
jgi:hypothetical protein